jgi:protease secretion system membrane fusion protein
MSAIDQNLKLTELSDTKKIRTYVKWILGVWFFGFFLWAALVPLDEGVPTQGTVIIETKRRPVQHLQGGTVKEVLVREGQFVKEGDLLIRLSDAMARAEFENARQTLVNLRAQEASRRTELALLEKELSGVAELVKNQFMPMTRELELKRQISQIRSNIEEMLAQQKSAQERFTAAQEMLTKTEIRANGSGQILGLKVQSAGAVINAGELLAEVVPQSERLILEAHIPPNLIDRIRPGDATDVRFSAFSHSPQLVVGGRLTTISRDVLKDPATQLSYYLAQVELTPEGVQQLRGRQMQPGMQVEVVVKTGSRTLLIYIADPLIKRISMSLKEE